MASRPHQQWLIYGLGGGMGHLTRTLALIRAADRLGVQCTLLTNSGFAPQLDLAAVAGPPHQIVSIAADAGREPTKELVREFILSAFPTCRPETMPDCEPLSHSGIEPAYDRFIVDTFPRGLAGELADLLPQIPVPKVLIHRWLNPDYARQFDLQSFIAVYDALLHPGETGGLSHPHNNLHTGPWLICDATEMQSAAASRERLRPLVISTDATLDGSRPLVLVTGCGRNQEVEDSGTLAQWLSVKLQDVADVAHSSPDGVWPLLPLLHGVDLLIGAGGYNTVAEARATGTPLLAFAQPRLYDCQHTRLRPEECVVRDRDDVLDRARTLLSICHARRLPRPAGFENGTRAAAAFIRRLS